MRVIAIVLLTSVGVLMLTFVALAQTPEDTCSHINPSQELAYNRCMAKARGTATAKAQDAINPWPQNVSVEMGVLRPQDKNSPNPYIEIWWDHPEGYESLDDILIDIRNSKGKGRNVPTPASRYKYWDELWLFREWRELNKVGCEIHSDHVLITGDCLDRFESPTVFRSYDRGFLRVGDTYTVQVLFRPARGPFTYSAILRGTISAPPAPTPTPQPRYTPTSIPWSTPTPIPGYDKDARIRELEYRVYELERKLQDLTFRVSQLDGLNAGW